MICPDLGLRQTDMSEREEEVKQKANDSRKAEERILGLMKASFFLKPFIILNFAQMCSRFVQIVFFWFLGSTLDTGFMEFFSWLDQDKDSNEKEIKERDKTIADKEQRIFDLKKQLLCSMFAPRQIVSRYEGLPWCCKTCAQERQSSNLWNFCDSIHASSSIYSMWKCGNCRHLCWIAFLFLLCNTESVHHVIWNVLIQRAERCSSVADLDVCAGLKGL